MKKILLPSTLIIAFSSHAQADIRINGFANLVAGVTSSDDNLYGFDEDINFATGSLFALQVSGDINGKMTATAQLIARGDDDFSVDFEWAYVTYQATDDLSISAGRFRVPLFRYSSSLDVGYSYHWIAPPQAVYAVAFNNIDGIRLDYQNYVGDWEYAIQAVVGNYEAEDPGTGALVTGDNTALLTGEVTYNAFKARAVYGIGGKTDAVQAQLNAAIGQISAGNQAFEDFLSINDDRGTFAGFGLEFDNFDYFISGEFTTTKIKDSYFADEDVYYITVGARFGKWIPSITYENANNEGPLKGTQFLDQFPTQFVPVITGGLQGLQRSFLRDEQTYTATIRYDVKANIALKADITRFENDVTDDEDATLLRFGLNYVF